MEEWRNVPGSNGLYQISLTTNGGRCRSWHNNKYGKGDKCRELSNKVGTNGYVCWNLWIDGKQKHQQAAVWIALTFPELVENEWFEGACIDHKDTDRLNNHPSNLRWVTHQGNSNNPLTIKHLSEGGKGKHIISDEHKKRISACNTGRLLNKVEWSKPVVQYTKEGNVLRVYPSIMEAERITGIWNSNITKCCKGRQMTAGGYCWSYGD